MRTLLALCPALQALRLETFDYYRRPAVFSIEEEKEAMLTAIRQDRLADDFPGIADLLLTLEQTAVLDLRLLFFSSFEKYIGVRWYRFISDAKFVADGWTFI